MDYEGYKIIDIDKNGLLINPNTGAWLMLNSTSKLIASDFLIGNELSTIINNISMYYDLPSEVIQEDIEKCYNRLIVEISHLNELLNMEHTYKDNLSSSITIHITNKCNLNCPYCYRDSSSKNLNELKIDDIVKTITGFYDVGHKEFVISGGEPTLHSNFTEIALQINNIAKDIKLILITNGTSEIDDNTLDTMCSSFDSIQISLDSSNEIVNGQTRGANSLRKVSSFINRLVKKGYKNYFILVTPQGCDNKNYNPVEELPELLKYAIKNKSKGIKINQLRQGGRYLRSDYGEFNEKLFWEGVDVLHEEMSRQYTINAVGQTESFIILVSQDMSNVIMGYYQSKHCGVGMNTFAIDDFGNVYPCTSLMGSEFIIGNVIETSVKEIVDYSKQIYEKYSVEKLEQCTDCDYRLLCAGGCRAIAYYHSGDLAGRTPLCDTYKKRLETWVSRTLNSSLINSCEDDKDENK